MKAPHKIKTFLIETEYLQLLIEVKQTIKALFIGSKKAIKK